MKLKNMEIQGYKNINNLRLKNLNKGLNIIIGKNNVGKSNILKAMDCFFNRDYIDMNEYPVNFNRNSDYNIFKFQIHDNNVYRISEESHSINIDYIFENKYIYDSYLKKISENVVDEENFQSIIEKINYSYELEKENHLYFKCYNYRFVNSSEYKNEKKESFILIEKNDEEKSNFIGDVDTKLLDLKYIYISDLNEADLNLDLLMKNLKPEDKYRIESNINRTIREISGLDVTICLNWLIDGKVEISIVDEYGISGSFENKSSGLKKLSYISLIYALNCENNFENIILGIEEPEAGLHTKQQRELLKALKEMANDMQIFITTHSTIFIDDNPDSIIHLTRNKKGNPFIEKSSHKDNYKKIKEDLGVRMSDSLFWGEKNVIVEGISEKILFPKMIDILYEEGEIDFSSEEVNLISSEGAGNICYYSKLVSQSNMPTFAVVDNDQQGKDGIDKIEKLEEFEKRLVSVGILNRDLFAECEIEDMIEDEILIDAFSKIEKSADIDLLTVELLNELRINIRNSKKNNLKRFGVVSKENKIKFSKLELATKLRDRLETKEHFKNIVPIFKQMDKFFNK